MLKSKSLNNWPASVGLASVSASVTVIVPLALVVIDPDALTASLLPFFAPAVVEKLIVLALAASENANMHNVVRIILFF
jgi:hypothetical protein